MTVDGYRLWRKSLTTAAAAVRRYKIPTKEVKLHHHWIPRDCDMGSAQDAEKTIELCDQHPETALHELAHLWTQDRHTKNWARALFLLHQKYLSKQEQEFYFRETKRNYKTAKELAEDGSIKHICICGKRTRE
jgi:hypothetical protein